MEYMSVSSSSGENYILSMESAGGVRTQTQPKDHPSTGSGRTRSTHQRAADVQHSRVREQWDLLTIAMKRQVIELLTEQLIGNQLN